MLVLLDGRAVSGEREAPGKVLLFAYGLTRYVRDGRELIYEFCEADADRISADFAAAGVDVPVDYHHQSLTAAKSGSPAPAAGWITALEKHSDGLYAAVKWTDRARGYLEAGEYRYTSPAFYRDKNTGRVAKLVNLALTNIPATQNCPELVAAENIPAESGGKEHPMKDVLELLGLESGLEGDAAEAAVKGKCEELLALQSSVSGFTTALREPLALEGDVTLESLSGMILGLAERAKQGDAAKTKLAELKKAQEKSKRDALIAEALEKGMPNAQLEWAGTLTCEQLEGYCKTLNSATPGAVPVGKTAPTPKREGEEPSGDPIFRKLGITPEELAKNKKKGC